MANSFEDYILDPLPPQSRSTPHGRAMLNLAGFAGRALSATGFLLLILSGATNLGATILAFLLQRVAPGRGTLPLIIVGISWLCWIALAFLRWRINRAGEGPAVGQTWGLVADTNQRPTSGMNQRATPDINSGSTKDEGDPTSTSGSMAPGARADGTISVEAAERISRASTEFSVRRQTPLPRVEAAQRSIRVLVGGNEQPGWIRFDLRPLVVSFVAVAASIPVMMVTAAVTLFVLLFSTGPF